MTDRGSIAREVVIVVLQQNGVTVDGHLAEPRDMLVLTKGSTTEGQRLPDPVSGKMVAYLARKYGIDLDKFYSAGKSDEPQA